MKRKLAIVLAALLTAAALAGCGGGGEAAPASSEAAPASSEAAPASSEQEAPPASSEAAPAESQAESEPAPAAPAENPNKADMTTFDANFDINGYYNDLGVECDVNYTGTLGAQSVPDAYKTAMPKAQGDYTIGFSVYYTVDEVGAMLLESMIQYAQDAGVNLLTNDANYDQDAQNQAIEQWIVEGVDGVIIGPCDFYGVKGSLDALKEAGIPCVTLNPALAGEAVCAVMSECTEQGAMAAQILIDYLKEQGSDMKGVVVLQTLPFVHPNAATRAKGFKDAFAEYPDIEIVDLTGVSPEEHYTAFDGAMTNYGDQLLGGFGLYSSATIGMINAKKAAASDVPITSIDNDKVILEAIDKGDCLGSCCYSSTVPAFWCMSQLVNYLNGVEVPAEVFYQNTNVTKDNVAEMFEFYYNGKTLADYEAGIVD